MGISVARSSLFRCVPVHAQLPYSFPLKNISLFTFSFITFLALNFSLICYFVCAENDHLRRRRQQQPHVRYLAIRQPIHSHTAKYSIYANDASKSPECRRFVQLNRETTALHLPSSLSAFNFSGRSLGRFKKNKSYASLQSFMH